MASEREEEDVREEHVRIAIRDVFTARRFTALLSPDTTTGASEAEAEAASLSPLHRPRHRCRCQGPLSTPPHVEPEEGEVVIDCCNDCVCLDECSGTCPCFQAFQQRQRDAVERRVIFLTEAIESDPDTVSKVVSQNDWNAVCAISKAIAGVAEEHQVDEVALVHMRLLWMLADAFFEVLPHLLTPEHLPHFLSWTTSALHSDYDDAKLYCLLFWSTIVITQRDRMPQELHAIVTSASTLALLVNTTAHYATTGVETVSTAALRTLFAISTLQEAHEPVLRALLARADAPQLGSHWLLLHNQACMVDGWELHPYFREPSIALLLRLFSSFETANFFFANDLRVVVDVCVRESDSLPSSSPLRLQYLMLIHAILMNCTDYMKILHKQGELLKCLERAAEHGSEEEQELAKRTLKTCRGLLMLPRSASKSMLSS